MKIFFLYLLAMVLSLSVSKNVFAEWGEWLVDAEISFSTEDNINRAINDALTESDQVWNGFSSVGRDYHFSGYTRLNISAQFQGSIHHEFSRLNYVNSGIRIVVRHKFGLGSYQPWIKGYVSSAYNFSDSRIRKGVLTHAGIEFGKPLHDRIDMQISYRFDRRDSQDSHSITSQKLNAAGFSLDKVKPSSVYDTEGHTIALKFNALLTQQLILTLGYAYRDGDIVSTSIPTNAAVYEKIIDAIVNDDALPGWAYRVNGRTHTYAVDVNYAFMQRDASVNLGYQHSEGHADEFTYRTNLLRINFIYHF